MTRVILLLLFLPFIVINAQNVNPEYSNFENSLRITLDSAKVSGSDSATRAIMVRIQHNMAQFLEDPGTYTYPFDSLKSIGKISSPDNAFRIFTWNIFLNNNTFKNYGILQLNPEKDGKSQVFLFHDNIDIDSAGNRILDPDNWYGALYYKVIRNKFNGKVYYTLLGLDSNSPYISKKVIDVLHFENGKPILGAPVFNVTGKNQNRMVFSFSARVSMMLNYDATLGIIVFDHLSPSEDRYTGQFEYYGPDFSFDGFSPSKSQWLFVSDVKPNRPVRKK